MPTHISENAIKTAILHISRFGDTDIFPHLIELPFLLEQKDEISSVLSKYDVSNFVPSHSVEALAPKSRYGFRIANQLMFTDCLLVTAAVIDVAEDLEKLRGPADNYGAFAYRFKNNNDGSIFLPERTYRDWIEIQKLYVDRVVFDKVVMTDIADFYQRIYFHRIENVLRSASPNKGVAYFIEKVIKKIRAKQSYGIPVGGTASRILAESILSDFDHTLEAEEYEFTRFVDDMRIFVKEGDSPYRALALAAETLLSEGLTLNAQKTKVLTRQEYVDFLDEESNDTFKDAERSAIEFLSGLVYFEEITEPDEETIRALHSIDLVELLRVQIEADYWDFGKVRSILRAMRLIGNNDCVDYIVEKFDVLLPFIKDIVLLLDALKQNNRIDGFDITDTVIKSLQSGAGHGVPVIRAWLMEIFIRGISPVSAKRINEISRVSELDGRQLILINASIKNITFFRKNKTRFEQFGKFEQYALILGASCLPQDEFETWLDTIKQSMPGPLDKLYCDWAKTKQGKFDETIKSVTLVVSDINS